MSEPHEPSYYEIALTNRQVVVAFVILLVCLLSAFFSGVWIGRESTVRAQEQIARNSPPPEASPKTEGQNLENLEFFDSKENKSGKKHEGKAQDEAQPRGTPKPTPPAPAAKEPEPPAAEPPVQAAPVPAPIAVSPTPVPASDRRGKGRKGAAAATTPTAADDSASPVRPAKPSEIAEPTVPKGAVVIQVFSSQDRAQADRIRKKLSSGGQKAFLSPVDVAGHTMYRVRIGPFTSRSDAQKVAEKVRKVYTMDTWVTE
ncbi:MAG TPA: SPOR domain-containing protein [Thermoanaerobaculia bacterium]|nr:SPOR domain-containing protein [Thermoanaerobaculia bacterium]